MLYQNQNLKLTATYFASKEMMYFGMYEPSGRGISIASCFNGSLPSLLDEVTAVQDNISAENYQDVLRRIILVTPETYVEVDGELYPLLQDGVLDAQIRNDRRTAAREGTVQAKVN